jgi:2-keto-4-pentenoate hydratase/2-oxohepta-3-ene-1,7-dioic acid hydratase in catechol pathway
MQTRVNGVVKQNGTTASQIFNIPITISAISRYITLQPGDIIATGTPEGIGSARIPPEFLVPGDIIECEIQSIGVIRNRVVSIG